MFFTVEKYQFYSHLICILFTAICGYGTLLRRAASAQTSHQSLVWIYTVLFSIKNTFGFNMVRIKQFWSLVCADPEVEGEGAGVRRGQGSGPLPPPGKLQVAIGFPRGTGTDPPPLENQLDPLCAIASQGRSVRPSVK